MSNLGVITRREIASAFYSPMACVVLTVFLLVTGILFPILVSPTGSDAELGQPADARNVHGLLSVIGVLLVAIAPLLTLRLVAEEQRTGTIETLMTTPVTDGEVILGKWLGVGAFYFVMLAFTGVYVGLVACFGAPEWGPIASHYIGLLLLGGFFLSIGVFGSSLTRSQIVAGIVSLVVILLYTFMDLLAWWVGGKYGPFLKHLSPYFHLHNLSEGHVDTRDLVFFVTMTAFWLFVATRVLESRKWR